MPKISRRRALAFMAVGATHIALTVTACRRASTVPPFSAKETFRSGEETSAAGRALDPIASIPENSIKGPQHVDRATYRLRVRGLVQRPKELGYREVVERFPKVERVNVMRCVEGWDRRLDREGVRLRALLADVGIKPGANTVIFRAADGYSTSLPLRYVLDRDLILATMVNGLVLPAERGYPFQLIAQGKWGYKSCKWVEEIELSADAGFRGYWESRGYSNDGALGKSFYQ